MSFHGSLLVFNFNDFFFVIASASLANSVWHHKCAAFAAFYKVWSAHFPVCSSLIASCFGRFILRTDRHFGYTSLNLLNISLIAAIRGILWAPRYIRRDHCSGSSRICYISLCSPLYIKPSKASSSVPQDRPAGPHPGHSR